jgi:hypothetical protein
MHAAEPVEVRADAAVGSGGGPGQVIRAAIGVTVTDSGLGQPARSSVDLGTATMCTIVYGLEGPWQS